MPNFTFRVDDGTGDPDPDPMPLPDHHAARGVMAKMAGMMLNDIADAFWTVGQWRFEVTDDAGRVLSTLKIESVEAEAG